MHFRIEQHFDAPLARVEATYVDPAFIERLGTLPKLGRPSLLEQSSDGHRVRQRVDYAFTGHLSGAVRRVVDPDRLTWTEETTLDRTTHRTEWRIVPHHYAQLLRCAGWFQLEERPGGGCRRVAEADIRVSVPLVGGKVEQALVSGLREHAALEERVVAEWLEQAGSP